MLLKMENITKKYGNLVANNNINLSLEKGEILAVIGENGAGKTTLMKILYGLEQANSGQIFINEKPVHIKNATSAIKHNIGMVQQHFMLFEPFTVSENIVYGSEPKKSIFMDIKKANKQVLELSKKYELPLNPTDKVENLPVGLKQRVEIVKVLYQNTDIIIFDEPTAVLTPGEVKELLKTMKHLTKLGKSIIIITHKLNEVMEVADRAIVMRAGEFITEVKISETTVDELAFAMIGGQIEPIKIEDTNFDNEILSVENLVLKGSGTKNILDNFNITVGSGEIVGIAGVSGNGQSELVSTIFNLTKGATGSVKVCGSQILNSSVNTVRKSGVALVSEDRYKWGSAVDSTLTESAIMAHYKKNDFSKNGILNSKQNKNFTADLIKEFSVKAEDIDVNMGALSGGNAQKLIVAREMAQKTPLLIACEPTRGVDIGAMELIHEKILQKRVNGDGVLLISSELSEIMKLSDRICVMYEGKIVGEFARGNTTEEELGILMAGGRINEA